MTRERVNMRNLFQPRKYIGRTVSHIAKGVKHFEDVCLVSSYYVKFFQIRSGN